PFCINVNTETKTYTQTQPPHHFPHFQSTPYTQTQPRSNGRRVLVIISFARNFVDFKSQKPGQNLTA
ncbi:hypothetical protein, partial [uncultured Finegoldia sp.]|uniref:hypothetical protein n=1 Tax=uncultured Finegoldia sp. TaxID=328009 RepID=UPI0026048EA8